MQLKMVVFKKDCCLYKQFTSKPNKRLIENDD